MKYFNSIHLALLFLATVSSSLPIDPWNYKAEESENQPFAIIEFEIGRSETFPIEKPTITRVTVPLEEFEEINRGVDLGREADIYQSGDHDLEFTFRILSAEAISSPPRVTCILKAEDGRITMVLPFSDLSHEVSGRFFSCYQLKEDTA